MLIQFSQQKTAVSSNSYTIKIQNEWKILFFYLLCSRTHAEMKPHPGTSLFRTRFSNCCGKCLSFPFLAKGISHLAGLNTFQRSSLRNAMASILFHNWSRRYHQTSRTLWNHEALQKYLQTLRQEYQKISQLLDDCSVSEQHRKALGKRHAELSPLAEAFGEIEDAKKEIQDLELLCASR